MCQRFLGCRDCSLSIGVSYGFRHCKCKLCGEAETGQYDKPVNKTYTILNHLEKEEGLKAYRLLLNKNGGSLIIMVKWVNSSCIEPRIIFRVLKKEGGEIKSVEIPNYYIPDFNFCLAKNFEGVDEMIVKWYALQPNQLLITYLNSSEINEATYYGLLFSLTGDYINTIILSKAYRQHEKLLPNAKVVVNFQPSGGFLFVDYLSNTYNLHWIHFSDPDENGTCNVMQSGMIEQTASIKDKIPMHYDAFSLMLEGGFGIIFSNRSKPLIMNKADNRFVSNVENLQWKYKMISNLNEYITDPPLHVYVTMINNAGNNEIIGPFLIYQTPLPDLRVDYMVCDVAYVSVGYICILELTSSTNQSYWFKLSFLSYGSVSHIDKIVADLEMQGVHKVEFKALWSGGYIATLKKYNTFDNNTENLIGYILDNNGIYSSKWDFPDDLIVPKSAQMQIYKNNSCSLLLQNQNNSWSILVGKLDNFGQSLTVFDRLWTHFHMSKTLSKIFKIKKCVQTKPSTGVRSIKLPKLVKDYGYDNPNIIATDPPNNAVIPLRTQILRIFFKIRVELSSKYISIYRSTNTEDIFRQKMIANDKYVTLSDDGRTLNIQVLESTFNTPNAGYFVRLEYNSIKDADNKEPLFGIKANIWRLNTIDEKPNTDVLTPSIKGMLRLTSNGTKYFESLPSNGRDEFFQNLLKCASDSVPVDIHRLSLTKCCQYDEAPSKKEKQLIIGIRIAQTKDLNLPSTYQIKKDLDIMIKSPISYMRQCNGSEHIDGTFGDFFEEKKYELVGVGSTFGLISVGLLMIKLKSPEANLFALIRTAFSLVDFVVDFLFLINNAPNVPSLYVPTLIFFILPLIINMLTSIKLLIKEITTNPSFYEWVKECTGILGIFTLISCMEIEILNLLVSNIGGLKYFNAPLTDYSLKVIFRISSLCFFIEDIPQLVIMMIYTQKIVKYDIIQVVAVLSSVLVVLLGLITRIYKALLHFKLVKQFSTFTEKFDEMQTSESDKRYEHI
ncbi:4505_t:CDS:10 [Funneliformis caledonium]|uniref:4505_t:CDS:1 n=1 Tax=Funneliformis caledonium TaxID=1117310 RepID=A0A9N8ZG75_9GLOM|nr:4505_t:CDS:10 [Funneliformis caledonium]